MIDTQAVTRRGRSAWLAAVTLVVGAVAVGGCDSEGELPVTAPPAVAVSTPAADTSAIPAQVHWESYQGVAVPFGADGPAQTGPAGAVSGFAHSPQGAALAAIQQTIRIGVAPDTEWAAATAAGVEAGPERDRFAIGRVQVSITAPVLSAEAPRVLGYRFIDYRSDRASLILYTRFPDSSTAANDIDVIWSRDDWRLQLPAAEAPARVHSLDTAPTGTQGFVALEAP